MQVIYWTGFSKRKNSTKVPTGAGTSKTCYLKDDTSVLNPTIKLDGHGYRNISYAQISDFGRYYFVKDVREVGPQTHVELTVDAAASHKSSITGSQQYVERANMSGGYVNMPDPLNPPTNVVSAKHTLIATYTDDIVDYNGTLGYLNSHYVMGVVGKSGIDYWGLTWTQMTNFFDAVFSPSFLQQFTSQFYNYRDCVISLKRVTYVPTGDPGQDIYLGEHNTHQTGTALNSHPVVHDSGLVQVAFPADDHLNIRSYPYHKPYTTGSLFLPLVGTVPLDVSAIAGTGKLGVKVYLDKFTADIVYKVYNENDKILGTYFGNAGADLPIAAQSYNPSGIASGVIQVIGGALAAFSGGGAAAAGLGAGSIGSGIGSIAEGVKLHTQTNGTISSFIGGNISQAVYADIYCNEPVDWNIGNMLSTQGRIIMKQMSLSSLSGYVQCRNAHVSIDGYDSERTEIESMLNNGLFIE